MVAIARAIIAQRTDKFDPSTYRDRYQEALQELIEATDQTAGSQRACAGNRSDGGLETQPRPGNTCKGRHG